jgi:hypothetical protein
MKQDVSPGVIAVIAVVLVAIIGFFAFKTFGPKSGPNITAKGLELKAASEKAALQPHVDMKSYSKDNRPPGSGGGIQ